MTPRRQVLAILTYMFGSWYSSSYVNTFIMCVMLLAVDFWTVKNISGRLMVGLRWWSEVQEDGSTSWKFEAREEVNTTTLDVGCFWIGLFAPAIVRRRPAAGPAARPAAPSPVVGGAAQRTHGPCGLPPLWFEPWPWQS